VVVGQQLGVLQDLALEDQALRRHGEAARVLLLDQRLELLHGGCGQVQALQMQVLRRAANDFDSEFRHVEMGIWNDVGCKIVEEEYVQYVSDT